MDEMAGNRQTRELELYVEFIAFWKVVGQHLLAEFVRQRLFSTRTITHSRPASLLFQTSRST